jgi:hypothetical protein
MIFRPLIIALCAIVALAGSGCVTRAVDRLANQVAERAITPFLVLVTLEPLLGLHYAQEGRWPARQKL